MLIADDEEIDGDTLETLLESENSTNNNTQSLFEISLQALSGCAHQSTMKLRETVHSKPVMILVDSGSTHSFIDTLFSEGLGLKLSHNRPFEVMAANREKLFQQGPM